MPETVSKYRNTGYKNTHKTNDKKIAVALSGGIDSWAAAKIMLEDGWDVSGITMKFFTGSFNQEDVYKPLYLPKDIEAAKKISEQLNIPHIIVDVTEEFEKMIIEPFCLDYLKGETPNPCIECNKYIKFGLLLKKAKALGAEFLVTGHYCKIVKSSDSDFFEVKKASDRTKDQSYFFWKLNQEQLAYIKTPLGYFSKSKIKDMAKKLFPLIPEKRESQEICFISNNNYYDFLSKRSKNIKEGKILNTRGKIIGKHKGYPFYTIGQRKGLGISYKKPLYVKEIIPDKNIIVACEDKHLYQKKFTVNDINFISGYPRDKNFRAMVKIRYKSKESSAQINILDKNTAEVIFDEPQRAVTPGQSAVFYRNDTLLGGGIIMKSKATSILV